MIDAMWPCEICNASFSTFEGVEAHKHQSHGGIKVTKAGEVTRPIVPPKAQTKPQPVKLVYKYLGNCPDCRSPLETLDIEVSKTYNVIAWCNSCKKQLETKSVVKL